jgi:hypothetical protein
MFEVTSLCDAFHRMDVTLSFGWQVGLKMDCVGRPNLTSDTLQHCTQKYVVYDV